ncbi:MAG: hypothetical protein IT556_10555 [Acetobacteraceae bacterium]|nr:hypothetical protein [Acetobacteraceae bacterium]
MSEDRLASGVAVLRLDVPETKRERFMHWFSAELMPALRGDTNVTAVRGFAAVDSPFNAWVQLDLKDLDLYRKTGGAQQNGIRPRSPVTPVGEALYRQIYPRYGRPSRHGWDFSRWAYQVPAAGGLLLTMTYDVPPAIDAEFNAWYDDEHIPMFLCTPGIITARRFRLEDGSQGEPQYLALYDVSSIYPFYSDAFFKVRSTPWTDRIHSFVTRRFRALFRQVA